MKTAYYTVAEHLFSVVAQDDILAAMRNYEPFRTEAEEDSPSLLFRLRVDDGPGVKYIEETRQDEEGQVIVCGHTGLHEPVFEFIWDERTAGWLVCTQDYREGTLHLSGHLVKTALDNALMVLFAMASSVRSTALFHSAVVSYRGKGYMFLGRSGTGKSTHASLWRRYIEGTELMNDDNPAVRIRPDGTAMVYGTPWSGKTPCYRNVSCPVGGIVLLSQAPYNEIKRLKGIEAYAAVMPSISGKRWDRSIADGLHETENELAGKVPVWHLDCLPDEAAAQLCKKSITE
ncbi:MAG: hypothetical protein J6U34_01015 [Bacteroidales bacterium]|nr:hypothetical protein [Bacteroidales bacterium]